MESAGDRWIPLTENYRNNTGRISIPWRHHVFFAQVHDVPRPWYDHVLHVFSGGATQMLREADSNLVSYVQLIHAHWRAESCHDANIVVTGGTGGYETFGASSDKKVGITVTLDFQYWSGAPTCLNPGICFNI